jgi:hypothetical protein
MARPANSSPALPLQPWMGIDVAMLSPNDLEDECDKRLKWLFSNYGVDNLSDLGLRLISEYCDWFSPVYRPEPQTGGRPLDRDNYFAHQALFGFANAMKADATREGRSSTRLGSKAATAFHNKHKGIRKTAIRGVSEHYQFPSSGTLRNWLSESVPAPEWVKQLDARAKIDAATRKAALRLPK